MSQEAQVQAQVQEPQPPQAIPLIVQYQQQLNAFKHQREQVKVQFEQLNGAIFACENMIKQYEDSAKQALSDLAQKVAGAESESNKISNEG
jgi:hypothetical protein